MLSGTGTCSLTANRAAITAQLHGSERDADHDADEDCAHREASPRRLAQSTHQLYGLGDEPAALNNFWVSQNGGMTPSAFYNPFDVPAGQPIGRNYDPTGNHTQGRLTVVFPGN